ncbi:MAG: nucleotidyltransferase [Kiritimatiellae bacterium]|nr:nucleotidyltransferase [Kiritimatiellia bacterium]
MDRSDDHNEVTRVPTRTDIIKLARGLNAIGARYVIIGGMAVVELGLRRTTMDIDLLIDDSEENVKRVCEVLAAELMDKAARDVEPGDVEKYVVVRINDEITVDLMGKACGISFNDAQGMIAETEMDGVIVPFASAELLWKTKQTYREKDALDRAFLRRILQIDD